MCLHPLSPSPDFEAYPPVCAASRAYVVFAPHRQQIVADSSNTCHTSTG